MPPGDPVNRPVGRLVVDLENLDAGKVAGCQHRLKSDPLAPSNPPSREDSFAPSPTQRSLEESQVPSPAGSRPQIPLGARYMGVVVRLAFDLVSLDAGPALQSRQRPPS